MRLADIIRLKLTLEKARVTSIINKVNGIH